MVNHELFYYSDSSSSQAGTPSFSTPCTTQRVLYPFPVQVDSVTTLSSTVGTTPVSITEPASAKSINLSFVSCFVIPNP